MIKKIQNVNFLFPGNGKKHPLKNRTKEKPVALSFQNMIGFCLPTVDLTILPKKSIT